MNTIDLLINKLCPEGVKYVSFQEVCDYIRGVTYSKEQEAQGTIEDGWAILRANNISLEKNTLDLTDIKYVSKDVRVKDTQVLKSGDILICAGSGSKDHIGKVAYIEKDMKFAFGGFMAVIRVRHMLLSRFLFYCLLSTMFKKHLERALNSATINNLNASVMASFMIPAPPLPIQLEIVRILDTFTAMNANLEEELEARKKQFAAYRDKLYTFDNDNVSYTRIGDITRVFSAARVHKSEWSTEGVPFWRSSDLISYHAGVENSRGKAFIPIELYEELSAKSGKMKKNDILITGGGTIGMPYLIPDDNPIYVKDGDLICIQGNSTFNSKFLYYYFLTTQFRKYLESITHDAAIPHYTIIQIQNTVIPFPSINEQNHIVNILEQFDSLCGNNQYGLFSEKKLRKKQYEYYRDKLLTFKEA